MSNGVTINKLEITIWYIYCIYFYDSWNFKIYTWIVVYRFINKIYMYMHIANKTNIVSIITVCKRYRLKPINLVYRLKLRVFLALFCEFGVPGLSVIFFSSKLHQIDDQYVTSVITLVLCCLNFAYIYISIKNTSKLKWITWLRITHTCIQMYMYSVIYRFDSISI